MKQYQSLKKHFSLLLAAVVLGALPATLLSVPTDEDGGEYQPQVAKASDEGKKALTTFTTQDGFSVELFAAEPLLANPVSFYIDNKGRHFVTETFRQSYFGVPDNRGHMYWVDDDLAAQSVEDRRKMYLKHLKPDVIKKWSTEHDRIRLVEDTDGDGVADSANVFSDGYKDLLDGTGAGIIVRGNEAWYTCIPHLWYLKDTDGDGVADVKKSLHGAGYGVRVALRGHDMHGLRFGPDGKLYYSIGDRGYNVVSQEGVRYAKPDQGAVFRCNPDGSELEVFATGLRNPQELAFDQYGNLFTGDNNCDAGDQARIVYIVEGGDCGWRMSYQYMSDRGPWMPESWWKPRFEGQAAFLNPPVANLSNGPSGFTYYPGVGLPDQYNQNFFLADFKGGPAVSGIYSFALQQKGAGFEMKDVKQFVWRTLVTDCDFGPDGNLYFTDWVDGWNGLGKGRIYRTKHAAADTKLAKETEALLKSNLEGYTIEKLIPLLEHQDQRVRQLAHFALADFGTDAIPALTNVVQLSEHQLARIHATWALGMIGRKDKNAFRPVIQLMRDKDPEIRAQAAKVCGDGGERQATSYFNYILEFDSSARVKYFAAMGLGKLKAVESADVILDMIESNDNKDHYLRHAGVMALYGLADSETLKKAVRHESAAVRMTALLALRKFENPAIAVFLDDEDPAIVTEAARAINDVPINAAMPKLASLIVADELKGDPLIRRVLNANFRVGQPINAAALAEYAANEKNHEKWRNEALSCLTNWATPSARDRVMGLWRPLEVRDVAQARRGLTPNIESLLTSPNQNVLTTSINTIAELGIRTAGEKLKTLATSENHNGKVKVAAIKALKALSDDRLAKILPVALKDKDANVRRLAQEISAQMSENAIDVVRQALNEGETTEKQGALESLAKMNNTQADAILIEKLKLMKDGKLDNSIQLDLIEAAEQRKDQNKAIGELLGSITSKWEGLVDPYRITTHGGDAERGAELFKSHVAAQCMRCHKVKGVGGDAGPDLTKVGERATREHLLESLVNPNAQIAEGFGLVSITLKDGSSVAGAIKSETDKTLVLSLTDISTNKTTTTTVQKANVVSKTPAVSSMPPMGGILKKREVRDVIEYLSTLK